MGWAKIRQINMETSKYIFRHFWAGFIALATLVSGVVIPIAAVNTGGMISNYCIQGRPFIGLHLQSYELCGVWVTFGFIAMFITGLGFTAIIVSATLDGLKWTYPRIRKAMRRLFIEKRNAKIIVVAVSVGNEHFIAVKNSEFLLRAENVIVNSHFIFNGKKFDGTMKWDEKDSRVETSINRREHKLLRALTTTDDGFVIHLNEGEEAFPYPGRDEPYYSFPLYISGSTSFLGQKIERVKFNKYAEVKITQDRKVEIR
jgi:hypothetical protein